MVVIRNYIYQQRKAKKLEAQKISLVIFLIHR